MEELARQCRVIDAGLALGDAEHERGGVGALVRLEELREEVGGGDDGRDDRRQTIVPLVV